MLISEVMAGRDGNVNDEFIELYNVGTAAQDLTGWSIKRKASSVSEPDTFVAASHFSGKSIQAGGYFLLVDIEGYQGSVSPDISWPKSSSLAYDDDVLLLYDASGTVVDSVAWTEIPAGKSYVRASWDGASFTVADVPTPEGSATP